MRATGSAIQTFEKENEVNNTFAVSFLCLALSITVLTGCTSSTTSSPGPAAQISPVASPTPADIAGVEIVKQELDVPYVPTPNEVVARMLEIARVNRNDVVYVLGSGDGRIVITAAQKLGARGVGYDLNPERVKEANENATKAGVTDRVRFVEGDLFKADIGEATVVTLYLLPDVNLKLRPKLLSELKPGTRIVSHNYSMGDWQPLQSETVKVGSSEHSIFYWEVPAK
jgi:hypothetical protein